VSELESLLREGVTERIFGHAALSLRTLDGRTLDLATGASDGPARVFDIASVTKVFTAVLALKHLDPDRRTELVQGRPTIADLLSHASGLPAWRPLFALAAARLGTTPAALASTGTRRDDVLRLYRELIGGTTCDAPRPTYSDLGFLTLGFELERSTGAPLEKLLADDIAIPLGLGIHGWGGLRDDVTGTGVGRPRPWVPPVEVEAIDASGRAPTADDANVDDDNAACAGGGTGHAGVRATAPDVASLGLAILRSADADGRLLPTALARAMCERRSGSRTLGLDTPSGDAPSIGAALGHGPLGAAGHLGFTGCSLWMDRDAGCSIALLTDAVVHERPSLAIRRFRPRLHDAAAAWLGGAR